MTKVISVDQVKLIYRDFVAAGPLMDAGKLEGAVAAPFQHVFGTELYPTIVEKSAKLLEGISRAQAYRDGNKRLAWLSMTSLMQVNGLVLVDMPAEEAAAFTLQLDGDAAGLKAAATWLSEHARTIS